MSTTILFPSSVPRIPTPLSVWAPLYPTVIAGLSKLGVGVAVAARAISILAFGLAVVLVWMLGSALFSRKVGALSAVLVSVWPAMTGVATTAGPEFLLVSLVLSSVLMSVRSMHLGEVSGSFAAIMGGLAVGAAALTWYPGIPLTVIGAAAFFLFAHGGHWKQRLSRTVIWLTAAAVPVTAWLARNLYTTGALIGGGRQPDDRGLLYHAAYASRTVVFDGLGLIARVLVIPELQGVTMPRMAVAAAAAMVLLLIVLARNGRLRRALAEVALVAVGSAERRFVVTVGLGYWGAVILARSVIGFHPLDTRYMMPVYPFLLAFIVAAGSGFVDRVWPSASKSLAGAVVVLCLVSGVVLAVPRSLTAGGPRLEPEPAPAWVEWVAANTPSGALVIGNSSFDYNFYLRRPVVGFSSNRYGISPFFDCRAISGFLVKLGGKRAYFVLRGREGRFDADFMGSLYGTTIEKLLNGQTRLPFRLVARLPSLAAYEVLNAQWECD